MKIFNNKKIITAAIAVIVISSIGISTTAFTADQMKKSSKTNTPALSGLTAEQLQSDSTLADATQPIVIVTDAEQTTSAVTAAATTAATTAAPAVLAEINADSVKQIVSAKTSGAIITELKLDKDDGTLTYEVKATIGQTGYEYKIDAYTGVILEYKTEVHDINDADDINDDDMDDVDEVDDTDDADMDDVDEVDDVDDAGDND